MAAGAHFGCPKFTFDRISGHFRSIRNFFGFFWTKWLLSALLDVRNSLSIAFLSILDQYVTLFFLEILTKWLLSAILDVRNSLSIAFLAISDRYTTLFLLGFFLKNGCRRPFWMSEIHFRSHFLPFQIDMQLYFFRNFFDKMAAVDHIGCPKFTFDGIFGQFRSIRILIIFLNF